MGLDMYAYATEAKLATQVDFTIDALSHEEAPRLFHYWRKHPNLHGWMRQLYFDKGGTNPDFNCVGVVLLLEDLARLEVAIRHCRLPHTEGFFFGASDGSEIDEDIDFLMKARLEITRGNTVFYSSWW